MRSSKSSENWMAIACAIVLLSVIANPWNLLKFGLIVALAVVIRSKI